MIKKTGSAIWGGGLKDGRGTISTKSGALDAVPYGFGARFEGQPGTNPEELIGAAHAACYAMFLSALMGDADIVPDKIEASSVISLDPETDGSPTVVKAALTVRIEAKGDSDKIQSLAEQAKEGCPISKLLNCEKTLDVTVG
ncbi:OsmC family peroxiredoxin [Acidimangrovimonas sediminis]|uniref:OsmC family peroxiredoxin n=1 Tax=Acidimangrovimonas sediminis TaxID=2056283 RepID=UPI000C80407D|nr:OsmC family peroxiredoxin [Acidimangrovimonas sediminis]